MRASLRSSGIGTTIPRADTGRSRKGFALVELIVAMILLAIVVSSLAALMYSVSRSSIKVTGNAYRNGIIMQEINRLIALPYDSVPVGSVSYQESLGPYPHTRVVTVAEPDSNIKTVTIIVAPVNFSYRPDTLKFTRTRARTSRVLCTTCS